MEVFYEESKPTMSILLGLLIYVFVPIYAVAQSLKGNVIFIRGGIVIELEERLKRVNQPDPLHPLPSLAIREAAEPAEEIFPAWIDDQRALATYDWKPQASYHIALRWTDVVYLRWTPLHRSNPPLSHPNRRIGGTAVATGEPAASGETNNRCFFPKGEQLAVGTNAGHVAIINPLTGDRIWKTRISEGYAKHAAFSPDGKYFYIGEQSPDGFIYAYDLSTTKPTLLWKYRMADDIDTSTPQNQDDVYAWVQYPDPIGYRQQRRVICLWWETTRGLRRTWG